MIWILVALITQEAISRIRTYFQHGELIIEPRIMIALACGSITMNSIVLMIIRSSKRIETQEENSRLSNPKE